MKLVTFSTLFIAFPALLNAAPSPNPLIAPTISTPEFKRRSGNRARVCGVVPNGDVYCSNDATLNPPTWIKERRVKLKQVDRDPIDSGTVCGVTFEDEIYCISSTRNKWFKVPGRLKQISVSKGRACGVNADRNVLCTQDIHAKNPLWIGVSLNIPSVRFSEITLFANKMCGLESIQKWWCATLPAEDFFSDSSDWCKLYNYDVLCDSQYRLVDWKFTDSL